jgi:hypothetical protein
VKIRFDVPPKTYQSSFVAVIEFSEPVRAFDPVNDVSITGAMLRRTAVKLAPFECSENISQLLNLNGTKVLVLWLSNATVGDVKVAVSTNATDISGNAVANDGRYVSGLTVKAPPSTQQKLLATTAAVTTSLVASVTLSVGTSVGTATATGAASAASAAGSSAAGSSSSGSSGSGSMLAMVQSIQTVVMISQLSVKAMPESYAAIGADLAWMNYGLPAPWQTTRDSKDVNAQASTARAGGSPQRRSLLLAPITDQGADILSSGGQESAVDSAVSDLDLYTGFDSFESACATLFWVVLVTGTLILLHILLVYAIRRSGRQLPSLLVIPRLELMVIISALPALTRAALLLIRTVRTGRVLFGIFVLICFPIAILFFSYYIVSRSVIGKKSKVQWVQNENSEKKDWFRLIRTKGEWEDKAEYEEKAFIAGYGIIFEDFRASKRWGKSLEQETLQESEEYKDNKGVSHRLYDEEANASIKGLGITQTTYLKQLSSKLLKRSASYVSEEGEKVRLVIEHVLVPQSVLSEEERKRAQKAADNAWTAMCVLYNFAKCCKMAFFAAVTVAYNKSLDSDGSGEVGVQDSRVQVMLALIAIIVQSSYLFTMFPYASPIKMVVEMLGCICEASSIILVFWLIEDPTASDRYEVFMQAFATVGIGSQVLSQCASTLDDILAYIDLYRESMGDRTEALMIYLGLRRAEQEREGGKKEIDGDNQKPRECIERLDAATLTDIDMRIKESRSRKRFRAAVTAAARRRSSNPEIIFLRFVRKFAEVANQPSNTRWAAQNEEKLRIAEEEKLRRAEEERRRDEDDDDDDDEDDDDDKDDKDWQPTQERLRRAKERRRQNEETKKSFDEPTPPPPRKKLAPRKPPRLAEQAAARAEERRRRAAAKRVVAERAAERVGVADDDDDDDGDDDDDDDDEDWQPTQERLRRAKERRRQKSVFSASWERVGNI